LTLVASNPVVADSFLTLHYRLCGASGDVFLDTFTGPPATLSLGQGQLAPTLEACLIGMTEGQSACFELDAGVAFGERNPQLLQYVGRDMLERLGDPRVRFEVGDAVRFPTPDGGSGYAGVVQAVSERSVLFDFNHPLAGKPVRFDVQLMGVL
jgi:FKBP-type peptidyl-prolyl cis-trans isomerase SlpA